MNTVICVASALKILGSKEIGWADAFYEVINKTNVTQVLKGTQEELYEVFVMEFISSLCCGWKQANKTIQSKEVMSGVMIRC